MGVCIQDIWGYAYRTYGGAHTGHMGVHIQGYTGHMGVHIQGRIIWINLEARNVFFCLLFPKKPYLTKLPP